MRDHVKKCKDMYQDLLEGSDAETGLYEPCFCKGDTHLLKEGLAPPTSFTYKLEEKRVNTKTIEQLILEFCAKAQEEVTAVCKACALHKRQNAPAPDEDPKKSLDEADTDAEGTPRNGQSLLQLQLLLLQPSLHPQLLWVELPKVPVSVRSRVSTMINWTTMMMWKMMMKEVGLARSLPRMSSLETLKSIPINSATHWVMDPLSIKVMVILTIRNPEVDPEVNLEADHLMGLAVLLPKVTESILVTRVEIKTIGHIMAHIIVMIMTGTIPAMTGTMMTDIITSTTADIMTGVTPGGMMTEVDTGLHVRVLLIDLQTVSGLMTVIQMT